MIACLAIPGFELRAALRSRPSLALQPAALAPSEGVEPLIGPVTAAAHQAGVRPGMRMGEALATCPKLVLVEPDPAGAERDWEEIVLRLEDNGFAVESAQLGTAYFDTRGVERLYGGLEPALKRALAAVGSHWDARVGAATRRFAALAAANVARPGQVLVVSDEHTQDFLAPLPLRLLGLDERRREELEALGVKKVGQLAGLPGAAVAERLGPDGRSAWGQARGGKRGRIRGRRPPAEVVEELEFPEAVGNEITLRRALTSLAEKAVNLPAPVMALRLELAELTESTGQQLELVKTQGAELQTRLKEGLRQVKASTGGGSVASVVEVAPWSRIPEARALFVPRDD